MKEKEAKKGLSYTCSKCKQVNDISNVPDFEVGGFICPSCGTDNEVRKGA